MVCWYYYYSCSENSCPLIYIYPPENINDCTPTPRTTGSSDSGGSSSYAAPVIIPLVAVVIAMLAVISVIVVCLFKKKEVKDKDTDLSQ